MRLRVIGIALLIAVALALPLLQLNALYIEIAALTVIYAAAAISWNIFSGYTGYIALGHAVFWGTGAYALALMCQDWHITGYLPLALLPVCGLVAMVVAVPFGVVALRVRGHSFVVVTIAVFFIFQLLAEHLQNITNGFTGLTLPFAPWTGDFYYTPFYYMGLILVFLAFATSWFVRNSKFGLGLLAIRDDEDRARGLGVRTTTFKLVAFVISSFFVGMAGGLWAYLIFSIFPSTAYTALFDVAMALVTFLGGAGTLFGPLLGAAIVVPAQQYFYLQFGTSGFALIIYGALFLVVLLLLPEGIIPSARRWWTAARARRPVGTSEPTARPVALGGAGSSPAKAQGSEGVQP